VLLPGNQACTPTVHTHMHVSPLSSSIFLFPFCKQLSKSVKCLLPGTAANMAPAAAGGGGGYRVTG
jgi:hypothetical protein